MDTYIFRNDAKVHEVNILFRTCPLKSTNLHSFDKIKQLTPFQKITPCQELSCKFWCTCRILLYHRNIRTNENWYSKLTTSLADSSLLKKSGTGISAPSIHTASLYKSDTSRQHFKLKNLVCLIEIEVKK